MEVDTTGDNILQKQDSGKIALDFVSFFYTQLFTNINNLIETKIIKEFTNLKINKKVYINQTIIEGLQYVAKCLESYSNYKDIEYIDSGSRRIDIIVNFQKYVQYFTICHAKNTWYVKNSIFLII